MQWLQVLESATGSQQLLQACNHALEFMQPLSAPPTSPTDLRAETAKYGRPILQLLKAMSTRLGSSGSSGSSSTQPSLLQAYGNATVSALHGLDRLHSSAPGKRLDLERQRYAFIRKLLAAGLQAHALSQACRLRHSLAEADALEPDNAGVEAAELGHAATTSMLVSLAEALSWPDQDPRLHLLPFPPVQLLQDVIPSLLAFTKGISSADTETKKLQLLYTYSPKCAGVLACGLSATAGADAGRSRRDRLDAVRGLLELAVRAADLAKHQRKLTQVLAKQVVDQGELATALLLQAWSALLITGDEATRHAAASCLEDLMLEASQRGDLASLLCSSLVRMLEMDDDAAAAGPGRQKGARAADQKLPQSANSPSSAWLALYLGMLAVGRPDAPTLPDAVARAVEEALALAASPASDGGASASAGGWWWRRRWWAALSGWSAALVEAEDALRSCGGSSAQDVDLGSNAVVAAMDLVQAAAGRGAEELGPLADTLSAILSAAAVAIKLLAPAASGSQAAAAAAAPPAAGPDPGLAAQELLARLVSGASALVALGEQAAGGSSMGADELQWMSVCCANSGLELLQSDVQPLASLTLQLAVDLSLSKLHVMKSQGGSTSSSEVKTLIDKRFRVHVLSLGKASLHEEAARHCARYIGIASELVGESVTLVVPLVKLHVKSRLCIPGITKEASQQQQVVAAGKASTRRKPAGSREEPKRKPAGGRSRDQAAPAAHPPLLTQHLLAAVGAGELGAELLGRLDLYACEELACVEEECRRRQALGPEAGGEEEVGGAQGWLLYPAAATVALTGALLEALTPEAHPAAHASALLLRHVSGGGGVGGSAAATAGLLAAVSQAERAGRGQPQPQQQLVLLNVMALAATLHAVDLAAAAMQQGGGGPQEPGHADLVLGGGVGEEPEADEEDSGTEQPPSPVAATGSGPGCSSAGEPGGVDSGWELYRGQLRSAGELWVRLVAARASAGAAAGSVLPRLRHVELSLQLLTQLHGWAGLHDDCKTLAAAEAALGCVAASSAGHSGSQQLRATWAVARQGGLALEWAVAAQPCSSLASLLQAELPRHAGPEVQALLTRLEQSRSCWSELPVREAAAALVSCAAQLPPSPSPSSLLACLLAQLHHLTAAALLRAGGTLEACAHAQEALRLSSAVHERLGGGPAAGDAAGGGECAGLALPVLSLHLGALLQCAEAMERLGCGEDAGCLLRECRLLARAAGAAGVASAAALRLSHVARRRGDAQAAAAQLEQAAAGVPLQGSACAAHCYLQAALAAAQSREHLDAGQAAQALACSSRGVASIRGVVDREPGTGTGTAAAAQGCAAGGGCLHPSMEWALVDAWCRLLVVAAQAEAAEGGGGRQRAVGLLEEAELLLRQRSCVAAAAAAGVGGVAEPLDEDGRPDDRMDVDEGPGEAAGEASGGGAAGVDGWEGRSEWPLALSEVMLHKGLLLQQPGGQGAGGQCSSGCGAGGAGGRGRARVLGVAQDSVPLEGLFASALSMGSGATGPGGKGKPQGGQDTTDAGVGAGAKKAGRKVVGSRGKLTQVPPPVDHREVPAGPAGLQLPGESEGQLMGAVLLGLKGAPALAARAAAALVEPAAAAGLPHAAALCLHLSTGLSLLHQHVMAQRSKKLGPGGAERDEEGCAQQQGAKGEEEPAGLGKDGGGGSCEEGALLLEEVHALVRRACEGTSSSSGGGGGSWLDCVSLAGLTCPLVRLDCLARAWLPRALAWLPPGAAVCSITTHPAGSGQLLLGRVEPGHAPLLVLLPPPSAQQQPAVDQDSNSNDNGCRRDQNSNSKATSSQEGGGAASADSLPVPACGGGLLPSGTADLLLLRLAAVLKLSAESMAGAASLGQAQKLEWWKARLDLDQRMAQLLADISADVLGPWRLLLLPRSQRGQGSSAAAAVESAVEALVQQGLFAAEVVEAGSQGVLMGGKRGRGSGARRGYSRDAVAELAGLLLLGLPGAREGEVVAALEELLAQCCAGLGQQGQAAEGGQQAQGGGFVADVVAALAAAQRGAGAAAPGGSAAPGRSTPAAGVEVEAARDMGAATGMALLERAAALPSEAAAVAAPRRRVSRLAGLTAAAAAAATQAGKAGAAEAPAVGRQTQGGRGVPAPPVEEAPAARQARGRAGAKKPPVPVQQAPVRTQQQPGEDIGAQCPGSQGAAGGAEAGGGRGEVGPPVLLVLGPELHAVPWESVPGLQQAEFYRSPSLLISCLAAARHRQRAAAPAAAASSVAAADCAGGVSKLQRGRVGCRAAAAPAAAAAGAATQAGTRRAGRECPAAPAGGDDRTTAAQGGGGGSSSGRCSAAVVDLASTWYLLNPAGDLADTQHCFEEWFGRQLRWQGVSGAKPPARQLLSALQSHELFVYCGHGSGEQYVPLALMRRLRACAASLLVGCSSGRLRVQGDYDPAGAVVSYLLSGCPAVVANLWDVTDRDIDRFCEALLAHCLGLRAGAGRTQQQQQWSGGPAGPSAQGPGAAPGAAQEGGDGQAFLSAAVAGSRSACKLPHLIGAAPVCYGIPTALTWKGQPP